MLRNTSITKIAATLKHNSAGAVCAFGFTFAVGMIGAARAFSKFNRANIDKIVTSDNPALLTGIF